MEEGPRKLRTLLVNECKIEPAIATYMIDTLTISSIADFSGYFTQSTYEDGVDVDILAHTTFKDNRIQKGRLRTAWQMAKTEVTQAIDKRGTTETVKDWDDPLDPEIKQGVVKLFTDYHKFHFEPDLTPSEALFGRLVREFKKRSISLYPLYKVKSSSQVHPVMDKRASSTPLTATISLTVQDASSSAGPDTPIRSVLQLLRAMQILCNGWAIAGMGEVPSKVDPQAKVHDGDFTQMNNYYNFIYSKCLLHPGPESATILWLLERDRQTRVKAISLVEEGWPWGEALLHSREVHMAVLWTLGSTSLSAGSEPFAIQPSAPGSDQAWVDPQGRSKGQGKDTRQLKAKINHLEQTLGNLRKQAPSSKGLGKAGGKQAVNWDITGTCCPDFNLPKGCTHDRCPHGLLHKCNWWRTDIGKICGATDHGRSHCPLNLKRKVAHDFSPGNGSKKHKGGKGGKY